MVVIVMGVSGCGKTTIGTLLAGMLNIPFYDADTFHPATNVAKMTAGIPLTDADRVPWLTGLAEHIGEWEKQGGAVLACSALKQSYRKILSQGAPGSVRFIHLQGTMKLIAGRMKHRSDHYMPLSLLESQFTALEPPEDAICISIDETPENIALRAYKELRAVS